MNKKDIFEFLESLERRGFSFRHGSVPYTIPMLWDTYKSSRRLDDFIAQAEIFQRATRPDND